MSYISATGSCGPFVIQQLQNVENTIEPDEVAVFVALSTWSPRTVVMYNGIPARAAVCEFVQ